MVKLGVPHLDKEHEEIIQQLDLLVGIMASNVRYVDKHIAASDLIKTIVEHITRHFTDEEMYMKSIMFNLEEHANEHRRIKDKFSKFLKDSMNFGMEEYNIKVAAFAEEFRELIGKHIDDFDAKISRK